MTEREKEEIRMAGHSSSVAHVRTAMNGSTSEQKNLSGASAWNRIGRLERKGEGMAITITDPAGHEHTVFITRKEAGKIINDRAVGDVVTVTETPTEIITAIIGKAFRSRTGRALIIKVPWFSGDIMSPWQSMMNAFNGSVKAAPVSIIQTTTTTPKVLQNDSSSGIAQCLERCF